MVRRFVVLDAFLVVLLAFGGFRLRQEWSAFWTTHRVENIPAAADTATVQTAPLAPVPLNLSDWTEIAGRNPFSFDRNDAPIVVSQPVVEQAAGPKPVLFGIMALGRESMAMMGTGQTGTRNARPMHVGEALDGWELVEIQEKSVVVKTGDRRENVIMNDPTAQIPRDASRTVGSSQPAATTGVFNTSSQGNNAARAPAPAAAASNDRPPLPPTPLDANGQPKKGRWVIGPFGNVFVEDDR